MKAIINGKLYECSLIKGKKVVDVERTAESNFKYLKENGYNLSNAKAFKYVRKDGETSNLIEATLTEKDGTQKQMIINPYTLWRKA